MVAQPSPDIPRDEKRSLMRLVIELDVHRLPNDQPREASRILRYWAGAMLQMDLTQPTEQPLMVSNYEAVGTLRILAEGNATDTRH